MYRYIHAIIHIYVSKHVHIHLNKQTERLKETDRLSNRSTKTLTTNKYPPNTQTTCKGTKGALAPAIKLLKPIFFRLNSRKHIRNVSVCVEGLQSGDKGTHAQTCTPVSTPLRFAPRCPDGPIVLYFLAFHSFYSLTESRAGKISAQMPGVSVHAAKHTDAHAWLATQHSPARR